MDDSPFIKLPPELRNKIYSYLKFRPRRLIAIRASSSSWYQHPISRTCRQLRAEAQHLNYRKIQINTLDPHRRQHPRPLLEAIGPLACSHLRSIGDCFERADLFAARMKKWQGECDAKGIKLTTEEVDYESITFRGAAKIASETYELLREMGIVLKSWKWCAYVAYRHFRTAEVWRWPGCVIDVGDTTRRSDHGQTELRRSETSDAELQHAHGIITCELHCSDNDSITPTDGFDEDP
ncbi:hypothetical protein LTR86_008595 [Recurvomyces mirabilis]|nr:hypothetical protein LTR86_008595 [Recurvomyces mirabilis]